MCGVTRIQVRMTPIIRPSSFFWGHKITAMSHCDTICQHLSDTTEPEPFLQEDKSNSSHGGGGIKNLYAFFRQYFWRQKNRRRIVAFSFARSETVWFLRGYTKCTEIIVAVKTILRKAFRAQYATFISRTSPCNGYMWRVCASWMRPLLALSLYKVSRGECARLRENVPYVKVHRYNPKHLYPKLNG